MLATGEIVATPERGLFMGNRGILHDDHQTLGKPRWRHKAWIICRLVWKDWHRNVMTPNNYTELFFLDEAVALAAGHRPCALCRRRAYNTYRTAAGFTGPAAVMDTHLHAERAIPRTFEQRRHQARPRDLPDGAIVFDASVPKLVMNQRLHTVRAGGYGPAERPPSGNVMLLTPPASVRALRNGYQPVFHATLLARDQNF